MFQSDQKRDTSVASRRIRKQFARACFIWSPWQIISYVLNAVSLATIIVFLIKILIDKPFPLSWSLGIVVVITLGLLMVAKPTYLKEKRRRMWIWR